MITSERTSAQHRTPLKDLKSCYCGGRPKIERLYGWWHIECKNCGNYPLVYMPGSRVRAWGWNSRKDAIYAWQRSADNPARMQKDEAEKEAQDAKHED